MNCTVAIVNWNSGILLRTCIESLLATTTCADVLVIDNASTDASLEFAEGFHKRVDFVCNSVNRGFAAAVNQAFQTSSTPYVLILNPDIRVLPGAVQLLEEFMDGHPRAAAVGGYVGEKYLPREFPSISGLILENLGAGKAVGHGAPLRKEAIAVDQPAHRQPFLPTRLAGMAEKIAERPHDRRVGASRERVNKALSQFARLGWIEVQGRNRYRIVNRAALSDRAEP